MGDVEKERDRGGRRKLREVEEEEEEDVEVEIKEEVETVEEVKVVKVDVAPGRLEKEKDDKYEAEEENEETKAELKKVSRRKGTFEEQKRWPWFMDGRGGSRSARKVGEVDLIQVEEVQGLPGTRKSRARRRPT